MFASAGLAQGPSIVHDRSMDLLSKIDLLLERKGWTQYRLEQEAGLAQNRISRWKAGGGKGPSVKEALRMARILGIRLDDLADESIDLSSGMHQAIPRHDAIMVELKRRTLELAESIGWDHSLRILDIAHVIGPDEAVRRMVSIRGGPEGIGDSLHFDRDTEDPKPYPVKRKGS